MPSSPVTLKRPPAVLILLGNQNDEVGNLSEAAMLRCDLCVSVANRLAEFVIIPTGAFGDHFNRSSRPHWHYLTSYLKNKGVHRERIVAGLDSSNTIEDAVVARRVIARLFPDERPALHVVTNDFHSRRVAHIFSCVFPGTNIAYHLAPDPAGEDLEMLRAHEERSLGRIQDNPSLFDLAVAALVKRSVLTPAEGSLQTGVPNREPGAVKTAPTASVPPLSAW